MHKGDEQWGIIGYIGRGNERNTHETGDSAQDSGGNSGSQRGRVKVRKREVCHGRAGDHRRCSGKKKRISCL